MRGKRSAGTMNGCWLSGFRNRAAIGRRSGVAALADHLGTNSQLAALVRRSWQSARPAYPRKLLRSRPAALYRRQSIRTCSGTTKKLSKTSSGGLWLYPCSRLQQSPAGLLPTWWKGCSPAAKSPVVFWKLLKIRLPWRVFWMLCVKKEVHRQLLYLQVIRIFINLMLPDETCLATGQY